MSYPSHDASRRGSRRIYWDAFLIIQAVYQTCLNDIIDFIDQLYAPIISIESTEAMRKYIDKLSEGYIIYVEKIEELLTSFDKENVSQFIEELNDLVWLDAGFDAPQTYRYSANRSYSDYGFHTLIDDKFQVYTGAEYGDTHKTLTLNQYLGDYSYIGTSHINGLKRQIKEEYKDYLLCCGHIRIIDTNTYSVFTNKVEEEFRNLFSNFFNIKQIDLVLLEAVRANTRRLYNYSSEGTGFNEILLNFIKIATNKSALDFINTWLKNFEIADRIEIENIVGAAHAVFLYKGEEKINLADLGYGVTQLLPILLKIVHDIYRSDGYNKRLFLLEEPETNLHPNLQAKLADFLVDVARKFHVTLLVETHSEYLIRKLQYLTAKKEIKPEDTAIYYFYNPEQERPKDKKQVERIKIQEDGRLDGDFGEGFFDEAARLIGQLWDYQRFGDN